MSEEEKKAIEELKSRREYFEFQPEGCNWHLSFDQWETHTIIDVVINYIEKIQSGQQSGQEYISKDIVRNKMTEYLNKAVTIESIRIARQTTKEEDQEIKLYRTVADVLRELLGGENE